jgi:predicted enzyme related to lactoylglutathione lyase
VKAYLLATATLFGLMAMMHFLRNIAEWRLLATDPWYFLGMAALGVVAAALFVWAWCLLRLQDLGWRNDRIECQRSKGVLMPPTLANGKICYVEIPAIDVRRSADFYERIVGWRIRQRGDGSIAFDDTTGEVSGTWVVGRPASSEPGLLLYIMVDSVAAVVDAVLAHGGELVQPIGADAPEVTARFRDPAGNVIALYQEPGRSTSSEE